MLRVADAELLALKLLSAEHADTRQLPETVKLEIPLLRHKGLIQLDAGGWTLTAEGEGLLKESNGASGNERRRDGGDAIA